MENTEPRDGITTVQQQFRKNTTHGDNIIVILQMKTEPVKKFPELKHAEHCTKLKENIGEPSSQQ